jgi:hypothetical protein
MKLESIKRSSKKDETDAWPFIRWIDARQRWQVDARTKDGGKRRFFATKAEAEGWRQTQLVKRSNEGNRAFDDRELAVYGLTVADTIKFTLDHYRPQAASAPVGEVIRQLLESKKAEGRAESYLYLLSLNLRKVSEHFDGKMISAITTNDIERFLAGLSDGCTKTVTSSPLRPVSLSATSTISQSLMGITKASPASNSSLNDSSCLSDKARRGYETKRIPFARIRSGS